MALEFLPEGVMFDAIRDMIRFTGVDGVRFVKCGVTSGALMDVARSQHATAEDLLDVYLIHQRRIHALADAKYQQGHFERDGLVLVRSADLTP
jgi:hypothetical protein